MRVLAVGFLTLCCNGAPFSSYNENRVGLCSVRRNIFMRIRYKTEERKNKIMERYASRENVRDVAFEPYALTYTDIFTLDKTKEGDTVTVRGVTASQPMRRRLLDLGFLSGTCVSCVMKSPLGDPSAYLVRGMLVALRSDDAKAVMVEK